MYNKTSRNQTEPEMRNQRKIYNLGKKGPKQAQYLRLTDDKSNSVNSQPKAFSQR